MTYLGAAEHAKKAQEQADAAGRLSGENEPARAFECLAFAIIDLSKAVEELATTHHRER